MASQYYIPKLRSNGNPVMFASEEPCNRDNAGPAFGKVARNVKSANDGQDLAGTGALVWEGEVLELPLWN